MDKWTVFGPASWHPARLTTGLQHQLWPSATRSATQRFRAWHRSPAAPTAFSLHALAQLRSLQCLHHGLHTSWLPSLQSHSHSALSASSWLQLRHVPSARIHLRAQHLCPRAAHQLCGRQLQPLHTTPSAVASEAGKSVGNAPADDAEAEVLALVNSHSRGSNGADGASSLQDLPLRLNEQQQSAAFSDINQPLLIIAGTQSQV